MECPVPGIMKKRAPDSKLDRAPSKKRKIDSSTSSNSKKISYNNKNRLELEHLSAFLHYVAKIMAQNKKCPEVTKNRAMKIVAAWGHIDIWVVRLALQLPP